MRFLRSASRAFSLGMRAPAPPVMVPLSVLQAVREDAKAHAAREAQLNDERFGQSMARVNEAEASVAREAQHYNKRIEQLEKIFALNLAMALSERDVARGKVTARALMEEAMAEAWRAWERLDTKERQQCCPGTAKIPYKVSDQLTALLAFPAVAAYLQVAEEDNGLARGVLASSARTVYPAQCTPLHARALRAWRLPTEVFSAIGENGRIAFAALVAFGGRNVGMYQPRGETVLVVLRVPPALGLSATLQQIRDSAQLPAVEASVELGVAGSGGP